MSRTPDRAFVPAGGKEQLHVDLWRHWNVKMTSPCHISAYSGLSGRLFHVFQYKMRFFVMSKKRNALFVWGWDRKIHLSWSLFVNTRQASWCQSVILKTDFFIQPSQSWWILIICVYTCCPENLKVMKKAKIRNRYNQVPHLTWDII